METVLVSSQPLSQRGGREAFQMENVDCSVCGKEFSVHPINLQNKENYTCDGCIKDKRPSKGRRNRGR